MDDLDKLVGLLQSFNMGIKERGSIKESGMTQRDEIGWLLGMRPPDEVTIHPPKESSNKGSRSRINQLKKML